MAQYATFLDALEAAGFSGDFGRDLSDRIVFATDNSIYQVTPDAVVFPRNTADLVAMATLLGEPRFSDIRIRPRGGGTGTNGQSLGDGLIVDCSRHMTAILEVNAAQGWARVQPGVIKDSLNAALLPLGLFFAPELSTSSRATIGGMISTDACGQGSCRYGKTSDHVLGITAILPGGEALDTRPVASEELPELGGAEGRILRALAEIASDDAALIETRFPKMNRSLTGYDLARIRRPDGRIDATPVICGAEGTLALIAEARVNLLPIPKHVGQVNVFYDDFQSALRDARELAQVGAASVETIDSTVLGLARNDVIWNDVARFFPDDVARGVNLVEFTGDDTREIETAMANLETRLGDRINNRRGFSRAIGTEVQKISAMRKKAVGLLGRMDGPRRPVPFVEDCAVPPEELEAFIAGFRAILDREGLDYGMFGHVDAGVLHVRPALDLTDPAQEPLVRRITEKVEALARAHGGLLWGEHGKGIRSEFVPDVFGPLYPRLQQIKGLFDPSNQMNPGKIAAPASMPDAPLLKIDGVTLRGQLDRQIPRTTRAAWDGALTCNGNGACFGQNMAEVMCPSYKATRDRRHSPKGRAGLVREWLRQGGPEGKADRAFEAEVKLALDGCLSCRACARACPVQIDVAHFRAKFMESWYSRNPRSLADHALAILEPALPLVARLPALFNFATQGPDGAVMRRIGLHHLPRLPVGTGRALHRAGLRVLSARAAPDPARTLVIVPDAFTRFFEPGIVLDLAAIARTMGFEPWLAPYRSSGKPLHVLGRLRAFRAAARKQAASLTALSDRGYTLVGIEPAVTLTYGQEYRDFLKAGVEVLLPQDWLQANLPLLPRLDDDEDATLMQHCTEGTLRPETGAAWAEILGRIGVRVKRPKTGCCGMAGTWGHETRNSNTSARIFAQSWGPALQDSTGTRLATGFSCRCQTELYTGERPRHPISLIRERLDPGHGRDSPARQQPARRDTGII